MLNKNSKKNAASENKNGASVARHRALTVIGIVMCVILVPILIVNCTLIIKSFVNKEEVPDFGGMLPLIVLTDSMYPDIKSGDIIICTTVEADDVKVDDVISFFDPAGKGSSVVTHKVIEIVDGENGARLFRTQGINNNTPDRVLVPEDNIIAKYAGIRFAGAGNIALFMQSTAGLIVCVVLPIILLVGYDVIRRRIYEKGKGDDMAALMAELEALKAANAAKEQPSAEQADPAQKETTDVSKNEDSSDT